MFRMNSIISRHLFSSKKTETKSLSMKDSVTCVQEDSAGNTWYYDELSCLVNQISKGNKKVDIDMSTLSGKRLALSACTPFSSVVDKCGKMFSNGKFYVVDSNDNEHNTPINKDGKRDPLYSTYQDIRNLLKRPNPLQSGRQFNKQVEITLKTFGFCPIYTFRAIRSSLPKTMWIIPPELFHTETTGKLWNQFELSGIIKNAYIDWDGEIFNLEEGDYFIVTDSQSQTIHANGELKYHTVVDSLSQPVSNWLSQMVARGNLIVNGGPKGIISDNTNGDNYGNTSLTPTEKKELSNNFKNKYGLVNKLYSIWVTTANVKWTPITYNSKDLMLHEEDTSCRNYIANSIGLNPNVFISDSKYANQDGAKRDAYQDLVIPDSENYTEVLTSALVPEGIFIKLNYSHISVLQPDKQASASAFSQISSAITNLYKNNLITNLESRQELSNYIDINPDEPTGEFSNKSNNKNLEEDGIEKLS